MPWATRLFLINLSSSDLLVGLVACAPAVLPAATGRWTYGELPGLPAHRCNDWRQTGGHTVWFGVRCLALLTALHVRSQSGA